MSSFVRRPPHPSALLAAALLLAWTPWSVRPAAPRTDAGATGPLGLAPAAAAAQQEGPVTLRLRPEEGRTSTYRFHTRTRLVPPPQMGMETTTDVTMLVQTSVVSAAGDTLEMRSRIDSLSLDLTSENEQVSSRLRQAVEKSRKEVVGRAFRIAVTRRGEVVGMGSVAGGGRIRGIDRSIRRLAFAKLPERAVSVGDTWSGRRTASASSFGIPVEGEVVTRTTSTLKRIFRRDGSRIAEIGVEATFAFRADSTAGAAMSVDMNGSSARTVHFAIDEGRFLSSSGSQDFTVNLSAPGRTGRSLTLQGSSESSAELVGGR